MVAIAKTGSGKTLGFLVPAAIHIASQRVNSHRGHHGEPTIRSEPGGGPNVIILAPTRELAQQINEVATKLCGYYKGMRSVCLTGGAPKGRQIR